MLLLSNLFLLLVNAVTFRRELTIIFNRVAIFILLYSGIMCYDSLFVTYLDTGIGVFNGLFHSTATSHSFDLFIYIIAPTILLLTAFYARRIVEPIIAYNRFVTGRPTKNGDGVFSKGYVKAYKNAVMGIDAPQFTILEYPLIILFILIGAILLMSSSDLISMFLAIELQSYGLYIFATLYRNSEWSTSAGLTYFLLGGLSSCFILLGSALIYANCGLTSLDGIYVFYNIEIPSTLEPISTIYSLGAKPEILSMGFLIMSVGYLFKVSAAPFHFWSPDVYDALDTVVVTFIANLPKISILIFLMGIIQSGIPTGAISWTSVFLTSSAISLIVGTTVGLVQFRIKRLLAYSTISHVGFLLLALAINSIESVQAFIFYLMQYSLVSVNIFFILVAIGSSLSTMGNNDDKFELLDSQHSPLQFIGQLKGQFHINPVLALSFALSIFSLLGIPPTVGFFAKQAVLSAALQDGLYFLTLLGILTSVVGGVYYLHIIKAMFFDKPDYTGDKNPHGVCHSSSLTLPISALTLINSLFIFYPQGLLSISNILALVLFGT